MIDTGALGKRTQYQQKEVAQLKLQIKIDKNISLLQNSSETHKYDPPKLLKLNDDLRLEDIKFSVDQTIEELPSLAQAIILCFVYVA